MVSIELRRGEGGGGGSGDEEKLNIIGCVCYLYWSICRGAINCTLLLLATLCMASQGRNSLVNPTFV